MENNPLVYNYMEYRLFLQDMYDYQKKNQKKFSYRFFSAKAGFSSPNFLKLVILGLRNLTNESVAKISKGFELKKWEREFFENLVFMNQAKSHDEKNHYYLKMAEAKGYMKIHKLEKASYDYFSQWYHPVIRELISFGSRKYAPDEIAVMVNPPISPKQAKKSLKLLQELNLIKKDGKGRWKKCDKVVSTGPEVKSIILGNYHKEIIQLASEAIDRFSSKDRDISGLTLSVKRDTLPKIKEKIARFREELLELTYDEKDANQVIQVSIQAFPLIKQPK